MTKLSHAICRSRNDLSKGRAVLVAKMRQLASNLNNEAARLGSGEDDLNPPTFRVLIEEAAEVTRLAYVALERKRALDELCMLSEE